MATIKSYTDLEQSRKLAKILSLESADMFWYRDAVTKESNPRIMSLSQVPKNKSMYYSPCWSLAALINVLPAECECMSLEHINYGNNHKKYFMSYVGGGNTDIYDNPIDACVDMIERLHKLKML